MYMEMAKEMENLKMLPSEAALLKARGYQIGACLGRGIGGIVYRGTCKRKPIAVKKLNMLSFNCKDIAMEVLLLKLVSHPNVVQCLDLAYLLSSTSLLIFMEYMAGGDLEGYLYKFSTPLTEESAGKLFRQIVEALAYMHTHGFAHRDLKPANILLDESHKVAKIGDFGTAYVVTDYLTGRQAMSHHVCGALEYLPPEALEIVIYDRQADIWSMGVILYEMLHRTLPFEKSPVTVDESLPIHLLATGFRLARQQKEVPFKESLSQMAKGLVKKLLAFEPKDRPQMADILKDEWLTWAVKQEPKLKIQFKSYLKKRACSIS